MKVILAHFSKEPFLFDRKRAYVQREDMVYFKPAGLWLSDETDFGWREWCEGEQFGIENLEHQTNFVCDTTRWAVMKNSEEVLAFHEKYAVPLSPKFPSMLYLNWGRVIEDFAGVLITPYLWSLRLHPKTRWYYGWDCASGCVWDLSTVKEKVL